MYCEESIFNKIKNNKQLVFKFWELTKKDSDDEEEEDVKEEKLFEAHIFGNDDGFNKRAQMMPRKILNLRTPGSEGPGGF